MERYIKIIMDYHMSLKEYVKRHLKLCIGLISIIEMLLFLFLVITQKSLGYNNTYKIILWIVLFFMIPTLLANLYLTYELQNKIKKDNLYKLDYYIVIATFRNIYITQSIAVLIIIFGNIAIKIFGNSENIHNGISLCIVIINIVCIIMIMYEFLNIFIEMIMGSRLNIISMVILIALICMSREPVFANALWIIFVIGIVNWLSSENSVLYYAKNSPIKTGKINIPNEIKIQWVKRKTNALIFTMTLMIAYAMKITVPVEIKSNILDFIVNIMNKILSIFGTDKVEKDYYYYGLIGYLIFLIVIYIIFLTIQNIIENGEVKFFKFVQKVPYISNIVEEQKKVTEELLQKGKFEYDVDFQRIEDKLDAFIYKMETEYNIFEEMEIMDELKVYPIIITKDFSSKKYPYFVEIPDIGGMTKGTNVADAIEKAKDYIGTYSLKSPLPESNTVLPTSEGKETMPTLVTVNISEYKRRYSRKSVKKTIIIPSYLNELGKERELNFSKIMAEALKDKLDV